MAYSKKTWQDSEVITSTALNNMENGIEAAALKTDLAGKAIKVVGPLNITAVPAVGDQPTQQEFQNVLNDLQTIKKRLDAMNA